MSKTTNATEVLYIDLECAKALAVALQRDNAALRAELAAAKARLRECAGWISSIEGASARCFEKTILAESSKENEK